MSKVKVRVDGETYVIEGPSLGMTALSLMTIALVVADLGGVLFAIPDPLASATAFWSVYGISFAIYTAIWSTVLYRDVRWQVEQHRKKHPIED